MENVSCLCSHRIDQTCWYRTIVALRQKEGFRGKNTLYLSLFSVSQLLLTCLISSLQGSPSCNGKQSEKVDAAVDPEKYAAQKKEAVLKKIDGIAVRVSCISGASPEGVLKRVDEKLMVSHDGG